MSSEAFPAKIQQKIVEIATNKYRFAYFKIESESGILLSKGGQTQAFEFGHCELGQSLADHLLLLTGLMPLPEEVMLLEAVENSKGEYMDIYLYQETSTQSSQPSHSTPPNTWLICQDRSEELSWRQQAQQKGNELELLKHLQQSKSEGLNFFHLYHCLPFEYREDGLFDLRDTPTTIFAESFPQIFANENAIDLVFLFPFLDSFMDEARQVWNDSDSRLRRKSGPWLEQLADGTELPLEAMAVCYSGQKILVLEILDEHYQEQLSLLQMGREEVLLRQQADIANQEKSRFLATMSHELRTPLNAIIGFTELCIEQPQKNPDYLKKILLSSKTLLGLIDNILDFSKLEAGKLALEYTDFDLFVSLKELEDMFTYMAAEKGIAFQSHRFHQVPQWIHGDSLRLKQVLMNLIANAIKFTQTGRVELKVENKNLEHPVDPSEKRSCHLSFSVIDTGIGIPLKKQRQIFNAFVQAENSTTREYGGTGLGLAICKQLVEQMGGQLSLSSNPGKGSTFSFQIPVKRVEYINSTADDSVPPSTVSFNQSISQAQEYLHQETKTAGFKLKEAAKSIASKHILLVEDDKLNQELIRELLNSYGIDIVIVDNGLSAVARVISGNFDCVLMDINMPVMDGYAATRIIRENKEYETLPIIGLSASTATEEIEQCQEVGMNDYISKPIHIDNLIQKLLAWIGQSTQ